MTGPGCCWARLSRRTRTSQNTITLLGIIAELRRDLVLACRHYRAAYALDPSYEPANRNLARITSYSCARNTGAPDYGDACKIEELPASFAYAEYKSRNQRKRI